MKSVRNPLPPPAPQAGERRAAKGEINRDTGISARVTQETKKNLTVLCEYYRMSQADVLEKLINEGYLATVAT